MLLKKHLTMLLIALLSIACSPSKNVENQVLKASQEWIKNFNKGDTIAVAQAYTENAIMVAKPFGTFKGREAIKNFWSPFIASGATNLKYTNTQVKIVTENKAILSSDWHMNVGKGVITNETWIKTGGVWKLSEDYFEVKEQFSKIDTLNKNETYVLVHAAWLGGWQWESVKKILEEKGHTALTPDLTGHGSDKTEPEKITMTDYVNALGNLLKKQTKPVILVGHSFNGITVSRVAELHPEKVKSLVYLTAFLLPNGGSFMKAVQGVKGSTAVDNFAFSEDKTYAYVNENEIQNAFAHDIPKEAFEQAKPYIVREPAAPLFYELEITENIFGNIPKYYIECTEDRAIPIDVQRAMSQGKVKKIYSLKSSHTPNFSHPQKLANILMDIANDK
jgi:pimeloyl-ACP methyl ester carboxylesterase